MGQENGLEKTKIIGDLYGLRAGLSVISQEKDKAKELQTEANNICIDIEAEFCEKTGMGNIGNIEFCGYHDLGGTDEKSGYYNLMADFGEAAECKRLQEGVDYWIKRRSEKLNAEKNSLKENLEKYQEDLEKSERDRERKVCEGEGEYVAFKKKEKALKVFGTLFLFAAVAAIIVVAIAFSFSGSNRPRNPDLGAPFILLALGFSIGCILCFRKLITLEAPGNSREEAGLRNSEQERSHCASTQQSIGYAERAIQNTLREIQECESKAQWGKQNAAQYAKRIAETVQSRHLEIMEIKGKFDGVYVALKDRFASELDERDWQHVDLIIYYYETGRAFTKQEALQLTDREVQTDRIVNSIGMATKYICETINTGFSELSRQLNTISDSLIKITAHVSNLSDAVSKMNDIQEYHLNELKKQSAVMNEYAEQIQELVNAENLSNALQEKANESSKQLMDDVRYFRNYMG